jgi:hypothetical protein
LNQVSSSGRILSGTVGTRQLPSLRELFNSFPNTGEGRRFENSQAVQGMCGMWRNWRARQDSITGSPRNARREVTLSRDKLVLLAGFLLY